MLHQTSAKVALQISCNGLVGANMLSANDSLVVVKIKDRNGKYLEIGRTERIADDSNPDFNETIEVNYRFEEVQTLKFVVYDGDDDSNCVDDVEEKFSYVVLTLGQIVSSPGITEKLTKQCLTASKPSTITIKASQKTDINEIQFVIHGSGLEKKDFLAKSAPVLQVCRIIEDKCITVHQTETIKDTRKPHWATFSVPIQSLCDGDFNSPLLFQVFDLESNGSHTLVGGCEVQLSKLIDAASPPVLDLINQKKKMKKKDYKNSGKLTVLQCKVMKKNSFLDYISAGCQINFTCGIDFTGSNGDPRHSSSLHYTGSVNPNDYEQAIQAVGNIIQDYDSDQLYPAFGFGAKIPPSNDVSHDFPLNLNPENPSCAGIQGIITEYKNAIGQVKLWGPTNIAPIINHVAQYAEESQSTNSTNYFILLLITDGVVTDIDATREAIVNASNLPMSVIIIGIGNADFAAMKFLDSDKTPLYSPDGKKAARDIVQFVPFRNFKMMSVGALASKLLSEIPKQFLEYFSSKDIAPICAKPEENDSPL